MCGRFVLRASTQQLQTLFDLAEAPPIAPRYNIAPTQPVLAVRANPHGGLREATYLNWGLIPFWAKDPKIGSRMINARAETAAQKPSFRAAFKYRRCIVPADGFYEWKKEKGGKQPFLIGMESGDVFWHRRAVGALGAGRFGDRVLHAADERGECVDGAAPPQDAGHSGAAGL